MPTKMKSVIDLTTSAIRVGVQLVGQFNDGPHAEPVRTTVLFGRLRKLVRALPPSRYLSEQLQTNLDHWPQMWEKSEYLAARYQMVQLVRSLRNYRDDWGSGGVCARPQPQAPNPPVLAAAACVQG